MSTSKRIANAIVRAALLTLFLAPACTDQPLAPDESDDADGNTEDSGSEDSSSEDSSSEDPSGEDPSGEDADAGSIEDKALTTSYQAEASTRRNACQVVAARSGSPSYVDYGGNGAWIEWNNVRADKAGRYRLTFRYANGSANPRRCDAIVNGKKGGDVAFNRTGSWTTWGTVSLETNLVAGNNTIRVMANTSTGGPNLDWMSVQGVARGLYTWTFGGLELLSAAESVALLRSYGYAGIVVDTSSAGLLQSYLTATANTSDFQVVAAYVALQLNRGEQFSDARHRAAIDALAQAGRGDLWLTFRDDNQTQTKQAITNLVRGIVDYAKAKGVRVVLYPHNNNVYATTAQAMTIVNEINAPNFGVALNLIHELRAGNSSSDSLRQTFVGAGSKLFAVTMSGAAADLTTIRALHESNYNLSPFIQLIKDSGFSGQVGFLNHTLTGPKTYLPLSLAYWRGQW